MASLADKNLPQAAQDEINRITAAAQAGQISWSDANKQANQVRQNNGANYTVSGSGTTTFDDNSTISSFKTGSQTSGGKAQSTIDDWNNNAQVSFDKNDYDVIGKPGATGSLLAGITANKANANKTVQIGNFSVRFNENGRPVALLNDGGKSATDHINTTHANDSAWHQAAYQAAQMGDWDLVGQYLNKISETFGQTGQNDGYNTGMNLAAAKLYKQELQNQFGYDDEEYYNRRYDEAYGPNAAAVWDATGGAFRTYADLVNAVGAERAQQMVQNQIAKNPSVYQNGGGLVAQGGTALTGTNGQNGFLAGMESSVVNPYGQYGSFEDFLAGTGYDQYADATQRAIQAAVQQAIGGYNQQIENTNDEAEQLARQAYINMMMGGKNLDQQLAAGGYAGGMADSQRIALQAGYENDLNALERQRLATVDELQRAIANAQLSGDLQAAQELSSYLQQVQGQWVNYLQNQQAMENENYWMQQSLEADNQNRAREMAMMIMQSGGMPDDDTLNAAGISRAQAQALLGTTAAQVPAATTQRRTGGGYNNGGLTSQQVKELQYALGAAQDGLWGNDSSRKAAAAMGVNGTVSADDAWAYYQQALAGQQPAVQVPNGIIADVQSRLMAEGYSAERLSSILDNLMAKGRINEDQAMAVAAHFGWK